MQSKVLGSRQQQDMTNLPLGMPRGSCGAAGPRGAALVQVTCKRHSSLEYNRNVLRRTRLWSRAINWAGTSFRARKLQGSMPSWQKRGGVSMLCDNWLVGRTQAGDAVSFFYFASDLMGKGILPCPAACTSPARLAFPWFPVPTCKNPDEWMEATKHQSESWLFPQRGPQEHSSSAQASQRSSHDPSAFWPLVLSERAESKSEAQPLAATSTLRPIRPNRELMARGAMICQLALAGIPTWPPFFLSPCPEPILGQWLSRFHRPA